MSYSPGSGSSSSSISTDSDVSLNNPANNDVLKYNSSTSKWTNGTVSGGGDGTININAVTLPANSTSTPSYSAQLSDIGGEIEIYFDSGTLNNTVVILPQSSVAWKAGSNFNVRQMGTSVTSIVAGNGVTLLTPNGATIANQYMTATVIRSSADTWLIDGGVNT